MRRRKPKKKMKTLVFTPTLPEDLIEEILLRLPVRSLLGFKCVCKSWLSLISDPRFAKSHFDLDAAPTHRLLLESTHLYIQSLDVDASLQDNSSIAYLPLPLPSSPSRHRRNFCIECSRQNHEILGSCRGFVLLSYCYGYLILWNPSTGAYKRISNTCSDLTYKFLYGFVYDESLDDYLVILMELYNPEVLSSGWKTPIKFISFKNDSWNYVDDINVRYHDMGYEFRGGSLLNGALHWLVLSDDKKVPIIVTFHVKEKRISEIPLPRDLIVEGKYEFFSLKVIRSSCLTLCCTRRGSTMDEIWMRTEYGLHSSWTKSIVMSNLGIPKHYFSPLWITKDGAIFGSNIFGRLEKVNEDGVVLEQLSYRIAKRWHGGKVQSAIYKESLLSLPYHHSRASPWITGQIFDQYYWTRRIRNN